MKKNNCPNNKAIAIVRVSSAKQKDGISHNTQEQAIQNYCIENNLKIEKIFKIVESASKSKRRTKYSEAIKDAVKNKIGNVLFYMHDRETRNLTDLEENEDYICNGVFAIHYVREKIILNQESSSSEFFMRDINGVMNKNAIRNLKTKVNDAMTMKAELGWYPSNNVPLGYMNTNENEFGQKVRRGGIIRPDDNLNNRKVALREFELRAQGLSFEAIRDQIRTENLLTPKKSLSYKAGAIER
jgi:predicted site-specific integrase-resolvase